MPPIRRHAFRSEGISEATFIEDREVQTLTQRAVQDMRRLSTPLSISNEQVTFGEVKATTIESDEDGKFIKGDRSFGIEYEINFQWSDALRLRELIGKTYKIEHDGSVRNGLEIVSPILRGKAGEEEIPKVCKAASDMGATADESCGLHVHFGAKDFFNPTDTKVQNLYQVTNKPNKKVQYIVLHPSALNFIRIIDKELWRQLVTREKLSFFSFRLFKRILRNNLTAAQVVFSDENVSSVVRKGMNREYRLYVHQSAFGKYSKKNRKRSGFGTVRSVQDAETGKVSYPEFNLKIAYDPDWSVFVINRKLGGKLIVVQDKEEEDTNALQRLKRVAFFYTIFDDVIASMLPSDRRGNDYARRISQRLAPESIRDVRDTLSFFKMWLASADDDSVINAHREGRPRARYCGLNLYALIKQGTIEVRYLGGTVDPVLITHWVHLHQKIINAAADLKNPVFNLDRLQRAGNIINIQKKTKLFFKKLNLNPETETYFIELIERYANDDEQNFTELIEQDLTPIVTSDELEVTLNGVVDEIRTLNNNFTN